MKRRELNLQLFLHHELAKRKSYYSNSGGLGGGWGAAGPGLAATAVSLPRNSSSGGLGGGWGAAGPGLAATAVGLPRNSSSGGLGGGWGAAGPGLAATAVGLPRNSSSGGLGGGWGAAGPGLAATAVGLPRNSSSGGLGGGWGAAGPGLAATAVGLPRNSSSGGLGGGWGAAGPGLAVTAVGLPGNSSSGGHGGTGQRAAGPGVAAGGPPGSSSSGGRGGTGQRAAGPGVAAGGPPGSSSSGGRGGGRRAAGPGVAFARLTRRGCQLKRDAAPLPSYQSPRLVAGKVVINTHNSRTARLVSFSPRGTRAYVRYTNRDQPVVLTNLRTCPYGGVDLHSPPIPNGIRQAVVVRGGGGCGCGGDIRDAAEEEEAYSKKVLSKAQKIEALSEANVKSVISAAGLRLGVQDLAVVASEQLLQQHSVDTQSKKVAHDTAVQKLSALRQRKAAFVIATGGFLSGDPVVDALFGAPAAGAPPPAAASAYAAAPPPFGAGAPEHDPYQFYDDMDEDPAAVAGMPGPAPTNGDDDPVTRWTRWMEWE
ncbi:hypothetical protein PLESTB_000002200 [Pleodorina starrii]|uniref:Uncharacterized protein n=1 Tax=Pleodorina starrii TaxID=330485 RepID=A0A9W6B7X8_9CHLO|nr:hypothetical protein PLESTB_000002200 [Pleodorina starrii]